MGKSFAAKVSNCRLCSQFRKIFLTKRPEASRYEKKKVRANNYFETPDWILSVNHCEIKTEISNKITNGVDRFGFSSFFKFFFRI